MEFQNLNDVFSKVRSQDAISLEQYNYLEKLTDKFEYQKLTLLLNDLREYRKKEKRQLLQQYKSAKKTKAYKNRIKNGDSVPYIDFYEGFLAIGREKELPEDFLAIEGEQYLALFFPKELSSIDQLITFLENMRKPMEKDLPTLPQLPSQIKWEGEHIEFAELIKALIEAKKISGTTEKAIFEDLCLLLKIEDFKKDSRISGLKKRVKDTTPLLFKLEESLNEWIEQ